jgi:GNAT superfamily N-acetyltransferase
MSRWRIKGLQFYELCRKRGVAAACWLTVGRTLYTVEEVIPVEKDLRTLKPFGKPEDDLAIVEVTADRLRDGSLPYLVRSRRALAEDYLACGHLPFALVRNGEVIGDVCCVTQRAGGPPAAHSELRWLGIRPADNEVYLTNLQIAPAARGNALAHYFLSGVLEELHRRGFTKAYGAIFVRNIPSLWMNRMVGFQERQRLVCRRFFFRWSSRPKGEPPPEPSLHTGA